jgi:curved DNA-binding protein CbpA
MHIPPEGSLGEHSLAKVLIDLNRKRATGTLSVSTPRFKKNVYLRNGDAIFASSSLDDERLGEMLVKAGKITPEQFEKSVERLKATGKRQGAILVELGYITPKDLFWGVKYQIKEIIYSLFELDEGNYEFYEDIMPADEVITLRISMDNLIYQGVKRIGNILTIQRDMPGPKTVFRPNEEYVHTLKGEEGSIDMSVEDKRIYALMNGKRSIEDIIRDSRADALEVMKTLYALRELGAVVEDEDKLEVYGPVAKEEHHEPAGDIDVELKKKVDDLYERIGDMGPDELLQVDERSDVDEIKRNYYRIAEEYHPDRAFGTVDKEFQDKVTAIFEAVNSAYQLLENDARREDYFRDIGRRSGEGAKDGRSGDRDAEKIISGINLEEQLRRGIEEFKKGNFWGAADIFRRLTRDNPRDPKYWSYLSVSLSKIPNRLKEAEEAIIEAARLDPMNSSHYAHLGFIYLRAGLKKRARVQFEKALKLNPHNDMALKGLEQGE